MYVKRLSRKIVSGVLAAALCVGVAIPALAQDRYGDYDYITQHVKLKVPQKLSISRPSDAITTGMASYFITGSSDPSQPLTLNGKEVTTRGARGSFGVFVALKQGGNHFVFAQGDSEKTVSITKGVSDYAPTTKIITRMAPEYDCATSSGSIINLSCVAPSGASVVATVGGRKVTLKQQAATAKPGVPAVFSAKTTAGEVNGTKDLGSVTYTLNGKTNYSSAGSVYLTGSGSSLTVKVKNNAASVYKDEARSAFIETARLNAVDTVAEIGSSMYRLSSGGWIPKDSVQPLTQGRVTNQVSGVYRNKWTDDPQPGELYCLEGTSNPMFRAYYDNEKLYVRLFHTTGLDDVSGWTQDGSELFSDIRATEENGDTILQFLLNKEGGERLGGYDISYKDGTTTIFAKYAPSLSAGNQPLKGLTIAVDAGHGGSDPGAIGIAGTAGATEKEVTLATAVALQKRLESLGASVLMMREDDRDMSMNDRMTMTRDAVADLFISLHCNSMGYGNDLNKISGTEVYYYEATAGAFASKTSATIAAYTGRTNRGAKRSNYRVTLNSYAPSVLIEMGFLSNPGEYDSMTSKKGIYQTVNAIADSILAAL